MPMPQTTPPISWLCEALGLRILPHAVTSIGAGDAYVAEVGIDFDLDELGAVGEAGVLFAFRRGAGLVGFGDLGQVVAAHDVDAERARGIALVVQPAIEHFDVVDDHAAEGRIRIAVGERERPRGDGERRGICPDNASAAVATLGRGRRPTREVQFVHPKHGDPGRQP
jgi:hypothetical protein